ncbi:hypothetical protein OH77DRAFT_706779 [Trametes cingulata]|nr:hypothetical protein OH77DRAFT_706779 [Trametes cingulata]
MLMPMKCLRKPNAELVCSTWNDRHPSHCQHRARANQGERHSTHAYNHIHDESQASRSLYIHDFRSTRASTFTVHLNLFLPF